MFSYTTASFSVSLFDDIGSMPCRWRYTVHIFCAPPAALQAPLEKDTAPLSRWLNAFKKTPSQLPAPAFFSYNQNRQGGRPSNVPNSVFLYSSSAKGGKYRSPGMSASTQVR